MATNSFLFKGWAITIAAALSGFGVTHSRRALLGIALISTLVFWGLDAYYLWLERSFITLYNKVAKKDESEIDFSMTIDKSDALRRWSRTCLRTHLWLFYGSACIM